MAPLWVHSLFFQDQVGWSELSFNMKKLIKEHAPNPVSRCVHGKFVQVFSLLQVINSNSPQFHNKVYKNKEYEF